jgi:hypothetical protein
VPSGWVCALSAGGCSTRIVDHRANPANVRRPKFQRLRFLRETPPGNRSDCIPPGKPAGPEPLYIRRRVSPRLGLRLVIDRHTVADVHIRHARTSHVGAEYTSISAATFAAAKASFSLSLATFVVADDLMTYLAASTCPAPLAVRDAYWRVLTGMPNGAKASRITFSSPTATIAV